MQITSVKENNQLTVSIVGRVDTTTSAEMEQYINEHLDGVTELVLDLAEMTYTSSAGLRVFLKTQKKMNTVGSMKIIHVQKDVMEIFDMIGFSDILNIE